LSRISGSTAWPLLNAPEEAFKSYCINHDAPIRDEFEQLSFEAANLGSGIRMPDAEVAAWPLVNLGPRQLSTSWLNITRRIVSRKSTSGLMKGTP
jgi:hypothetical protein